MTEVIQAASELQAVCQAQGWQFCFIGGLALQRWGEPRLTVDVDLTLLTGFGGEEPFIRTLLEHFSGRIPDAAQFALHPLHSIGDRWTAAETWPTVAAYLESLRAAGDGPCWTAPRHHFRRRL